MRPEGSDLIERSRVRQSIRPLPAPEDEQQHRRAARCRWPRGLRGRRLRSLPFLVAPDRGGLRREAEAPAGGRVRAHGAVARTDGPGLAGGRPGHAPVRAQMRGERQVRQGISARPPYSPSPSPTPDAPEHPLVLDASAISC
jgi:hypothetical protein